MLTILATIVALSVLILIHELGHFFAAKSVGIAAPRFSLGFGPRVWGFRRGETEFVLSAIPLGGYVKMAGMEDDEAAEGLEGGAASDQAPVPPERTFDSKPVWARTWVISAGVIMNLLFALVANVIIIGVRGEEYISESRLAPRPELGGAAAQVERIPFGARVVSVGGAPVAHWTEMYDSLKAAPAGVVALGLEGHGEVPLTLPPAGPRRDTLLSGLAPLMEPVLDQVLPGHAADRAGLRPNDRIVAVDGEPIQLWTELTRRVRASPGKTLRVEVEREGMPVTLVLTPRPRKERGDTVGQMGATVLSVTGFEKVGPFAAVRSGTRVTVGMVTLLVTTVRDLVTGRLSPRELGGLGTIGQASGESAARGIWTYLFFLAFLSVNLAILNLLPIPILDGGHLMFLAFEAVRGRPLSTEWRIRLSHVGLLIVVGLMVWANGNDVARWVEGLLSR